MRTTRLRVTMPDVEPRVVERVIDVPAAITLEGFGVTETQVRAEVAGFEPARGLQTLNPLSRRAP